jgi:hypothetical protein
MKAIDFVLLVAKNVPELPISGRTRITLLDKKTTDSKYTSASFFVSLFFSIILLIGTGSIPFSLVSFAIIFYFLLKLPDIELKKEIAEIKSELPFFMREAGFLVDLGLPFDKAMEEASKEKGKLSEHICLAIEEMKLGSTFQKAISRIAIETDSTQVKRAFSALISAYETGKGSNLEKISDEFLMIQRHEIKDSSSKIALFGLLFIAFSAVAPTFFVIYFILGESIFQSGISRFAFVFVMLILFPVIDVMILILASSVIPAHGKKEKFYLNPLEFYEKRKKVEELEKYLPDALLSISSVPPGSSAETAFSAVAKGKYGRLSSEFEISLKQLRSKISLNKVLDDLSARNESAMLSKAADMLSCLFSTNNFAMSAKLAEDFITEQEIIRERANAFSMQKYTLFFGALIIPLILAITISLSTNMASMMGKTISEVSLQIQAFLVIYCAMAAYFSAYMENRKSMALVYFVLLAALSLLTFNIVKIVW